MDDSITADFYFNKYSAHGKKRLSTTVQLAMEL